MSIPKTRKRLYVRIVALLTLTLVITAVSYALAGAFNRPDTTPVTQHTNNTPPAIPVAKKADVGLPSRLIIPKLNIDANVLHLGLTKEGNMDVPSDLMNTGWYKYGPRPGQTGSAVIAGHLEGVDEDGIFINLGKLIKGDIISVKDDAGMTISFTVRETRLYNQDERPSEVFNTTDGSHLNLITCTGTWSTAQQRYSKRLVVFADKSS